MSQGRSLTTTSWIAVPTLLAACSFVSSASAESARHEEAVTNFEAGRRLIEKDGNCAGAIPRFQKSIELEPNIGARLSLAECYSKDAKHAGDAWNQYKQAEQLAIQKSDPRVDEARKAEQELDPKVTKIILALPSDVPDAVVQIDGVAVPGIDFVLLPTGYALDPSVPHRIDVTAPGRKHWTKGDLKGTAGTTLEAMTVDLGAPPPALPVNDGSGQRTLGMIVGGVGLAGVVVGAIFGGVAAGKAGTYKDDVKSLCGSSLPASNCSSANKAVLDPEESSAKTPATISTIGFIAGGVLVAAGAVIYFTAPKAASTAAAKRIYLTPAVGKNDAGFLLGGVF